MNKSEIQAIYALTPMQQGILFHSLQEESQSGMYLIQYVFELQGELDLEHFRRAWQAVCDRYSILRTMFAW